MGPDPPFGNHRSRGYQTSGIRIIKPRGLKWAWVPGDALRHALYDHGTPLSRSSPPQGLTEQLFPRAAGNLFDLHARQREGWGGRDGSTAARGQGGDDLGDQRGLEGPLDAAAHQVAEGDLVDVSAQNFACGRQKEAAL